VRRSLVGWDVLKRPSRRISTIQPAIRHARSRRDIGACRGCGAPTAPRNGKGDAYAYCKRCHPGAIAPAWTRERVREAMRAWRARYGAAPSSYDWSRTHARRRGGEALKRLQAGMARTVHCHRPVRGLGGGPCRRVRRCLNVWAVNAVDTRTPRPRLAVCGRGRRRSPQTLRPFVYSSNAGVGAGGCWARGATSDVRLQAGAYRAASKHIDDSRNRSSTSLLRARTPANSRPRRCLRRP
jgi:hypothetical protein